MKTPVSQVTRHKAVLAFSRLTLSQTEVEYWEYERGFLEHAREVRRAPRAPERKERRADNIHRVRNTVRRLVNCNVRRYGFEPVFLTFTYRDNMRDIETAWLDWKAFIRKLSRDNGEFEFLNVMEFQKRGAIHFHAIFFNMRPELEKSERTTRYIAGLWGHGFVDIERIRSAKNAGAYVCKYLDKSVDDERLRGKKFVRTR